MEETFYEISLRGINISLFTSYSHVHYFACPISFFFVLQKDLKPDVFNLLAAGWSLFIPPWPPFFPGMVHISLAQWFSSTC